MPKGCQGSESSRVWLSLEPLLPLSSAPHGEGPVVEELAKGSNAERWTQHALKLLAPPSQTQVVGRSYTYIEQTRKPSWVQSGSGQAVGMRKKMELLGVQLRNQKY